MKKLLSALTALASLLLPLSALAEETSAGGIHLDGAAFLDSLQYMLKGMVGIFLVTGIIILAVVILEKVIGKKKNDADQ